MNQATSFEVTEQNFASQVIEASHQQPVLVDFWATWCGPCQSLMPILEQLAQSYQGKFLLAKVEIDSQQGLASQFGVRSVPTVKLVKNGQIVDEFTGALPESRFVHFWTNISKMNLTNSCNRRSCYTNRETARPPCRKWDKSCRRTRTI